MPTSAIDGPVRPVVLLDLFGGSPRLLVSNLLESGTLTLADLKELQAAVPRRRGRSREGDGDA